jgi:hypothetical protein
MKKVALDTHYVIGWSDWRRQACLPEVAGRVKLVHDNLERLIAQAEQGRICLAVSSRFVADKIHDKDEARRTRHLEDFEELKRRSVVELRSTFRFGVGWGRWATDEDRALAKQLAEIMFGGEVDAGCDQRWLNKVADLDHLREAIRAGFDVFLTEERDIRVKRKRLGEFGIDVLSLSDFLVHFEQETASEAG